MKKPNKTLYIIIFLCLIIIFLGSASKLFNYLKDMSTNNKLQKTIISDVVTTSLDTNEMQIDFTKLALMNEDAVGWINFNNNKINYPIVQAQDNDYYLNRSFDKKYNQNGSIFVDSRNNLFNDQNTVIYGHSMLDGSMFGSLREVFKDGFFDNKDNNYISIYTKEGKMIYQIFSYYVIEAEDYYITTSFNSSEFLEFIDTLKSRSEKDFDVNITEEDKIITLSTCYGTGGTSKRKVVHAVRVL